MKEFNCVSGRATGFDDMAHSFAHRKASKNVGKESVGSFMCILLANNIAIYAT